MFPKGSDGKGEAVGLFLTYAGAAPVQVRGWKEDGRQPCMHASMPPLQLGFPVPA